MGGLQQIASKIGDVESEAEEHKLVLETLEPLPGDRKCFRMINGVLVERTVKDVVPALKTNSEGLKKVLEDLVKQYNNKQMEMESGRKRTISRLSNNELRLAWYEHLWISLADNATDLSRLRSQGVTSVCMDD